VPPEQTILAANADFQLALALLTNRKQRSRQKLVAVQGVMPIDAALASGARFDSVWSPAGRELSRWASETVERSGARRHVRLAAGLFAELAGKEEPGELVALVELPRRSLADVQVGDPAFVVVLDRPASPGNLGSIVRTADAFGADAVVVTGHAADVFDPQAVRASLGAVFSLPTVQDVSPAEVAAWLTRARVVGTSARASVSLDGANLGGPVALVFGNEAAGLSHAWRELCDEIVSIPIAGVASSLNLASAAAIVLNEARRQRG
jgi:TrmH family RNA methyltransferase